MKLFRILSLFGLFALAFNINLASANHAWGGYHWARTSNPFTLKLGDNLSTSWDSYLNVASADWSQSTVLDTTVVPGSANPKNCKAVSGQVQVCNSRYGNNGWLGIASIWISGSHITAGTVKMNDTYFNTSRYNTPAWKQFVVCQEVGHTFGLDHQDENFDNPNMNTCMDYTSNPSTNQHPNAHDYEELELIYAHLDSTTTIGSSILNSRGQEFGEEASDWGRSIRTSSDGKPSLFVKDLGNGNAVITHIIWAQ
ncbi:MAG: hypothetical protein A3I07_04530 [Candidatus Doudnabacteria bacterium RIFCSPLOWO2_02_FULL_42_9]|uniref:Peptidase M10 metallopeptidase domain-containing protein n=1 Tax=Candidatus Doudnabacteria bacterium RIFCSPHIGHO2_01_FULL_41_86 TaxID=1817821 RepID=A0A1F5NA16_9BACT|nr:MAG: hypothetical protein A2717_01960 [Candidatus Doudnabacteria bacterium RIFCSPHIGHO2_01_FULL_41_86]OGE75085.1 MAG: hypothetical protein A3K07_03850 [Candidatus Doudnabacteria bacterium RIFCSPHIGHO2_01_43_10]OGE85329.1 MAG: hypothetical protein A3E28_01530 [Candidatus Doudnabacteria bacterium RIFCSPHIGHO2_12_FULL_42_22]OGE86867.1 MAG: hypothetical protein A3C49_02365 [Candidatus Doudnabacteria bacterium RIFCSPHIGHO2_02_FULL_42_25]OGE92466.1 MAG: hypothetical protein A2895_02520 [Candidatus